MKSSNTLTNKEIRGDHDEDTREKVFREKISRQLKELLTDVIIPDGYALRHYGVYSEAEDKIICDAPIWISHEIADTNGRGRTLVVVGINPQLEVVRTELPFALIHGSPGSLAAALSSDGLRVRYGSAREVGEYLNSFIDVPIRVRVVQPGWQGDPKKQMMFALRDRVIGGGEFDMSRLMDNPYLNGLTSQGTLDEWIESVATPAGDHPVVAFSILVGLASPLIKLLDAESFGFLLRGGSSTGKTSALMCMASVFGRPVMGSDSLILNFNATGNAVEGAFIQRNDVGVPIDELGMFQGQDFKSVIYRMFGGVSKARMNRDGSLRESFTFRSIMLASGEKQVDELLAEDRNGGGIRAGQLVRLMNIETAGKIIVAHTVEEAKAEVQALREAVSRNFGTAGPAFVTSLIQNLQDPNQDGFTIEALRSEWDELTTKLMAKDAEVHQQRAIRNLALIALAGSIACLFEILPYEPQDVVMFVQIIRDMYLANGSTSDAALAARRLRDYMIDNADRYDDVTTERDRTRAHLGDYWIVNGIRYFLFSKSSLCKAAGVTSPNDLLHYLKLHGLIHQNNGDNKLQSRVPIARDYEDVREDYRRQASCYCISEVLTRWMDDQPSPTRAALLGGSMRPKHKIVPRKISND